MCWPPIVYFAGSAPLLAQVAGPRQGVEAFWRHTCPWPAWVTALFLLACVPAFAALYALERGDNPLKKIPLALFRLTLVGLLVFMLYGWMKHEFTTDLPDVLVLLDDSASMAHVDHYEDRALADAIAERLARAGFSHPARVNLAKTLLLENDAALLTALQAKYNLKILRVGASARPHVAENGDLAGSLRDAAAAEPRSRLGKCLRDALESQRGRPTAAVIVFTDGVTTEGKSLGETADAARRKAIPLFTIGLGNSQPPRDVRLGNLLADESVFVNDLVNFDARVGGAGFEGQPLKLRLKRQGDDRVLAEQTILAPPAGQTTPARLSYRPAEKGEFTFVVEIEPRPGEANLDNNRATALVGVRDETIKVLLTQAYPSYEYRYLKNLLGREAKRQGQPAVQAVELTTVLQEADLEYAEQDEHAERVFPVKREELFGYDVLILGDVNPQSLGQKQREDIVAFVQERGGGVVFIAGPRHNPLAYRDTVLEPLFPVDLSTAAVPPADALLTEAAQVRPTRVGLAAPHWQLGDTPAETARIWAGLPGVYWWCEAGDARPGARVLAEHPARFDARGRNLPLVTLHYVGAGKVLFHATDQTYVWRRRAGDAYYGRYWIQTIRYLSRAKLLGEHGAVQVTSDRVEYRQGEPVRLRARFFDERQAPPQDDGVTLVLEQVGGGKRQARLRRDAVDRGLFEGLLDNLPQGQYRAWLATPALPGKPPTRAFSVEAPPGEQSRLEMDAADLRLAAERTEGKFYTWPEADTLARDLPPGRQVRIDALPPEPRWNWWPFTLAFVLVLSLEWLLRRRLGML